MQVLRENQQIGGARAPLLVTTSDTPPSTSHLGKMAIITGSWTVKALASIAVGAGVGSGVASLAFAGLGVWLISTAVSTARLPNQSRGSHVELSVGLGVASATTGAVTGFCAALAAAGKLEGAAAVIVGMSNTAPLALAAFADDGKPVYDRDRDGPFFG